MNRALQRKDEVRLRLLQAIYEMTDGRTDSGIDLDEEFSKRVGGKFDEVLDAAEYLFREGLLKRMGGDVYVITHEGVVEAEESYRSPSKGTDHFPPAVIAIVSGSNNVFGSYQAGGSGNTATVNQTVTNTATQRVVQDLREKAAELPPEKHGEVHSVIDDIENAIEKGPKALADISGMFMKLVTYWPDAIPWLTSQAAQVIHALGG
jgi:hypothetical protein